MPVEHQGLNHFSKAAAFLVAREATKAGAFGRRKVPAGATQTCPN
jgi:hypothetical protein